MAFSRTKYDNKVYNLEIERSTTQGDYRLNSYFAENNDICFSYDGPIGSKSDVSLVKNNNMIELESDLLWRNNKNSKSNENINKLNNYKLNHKNNCSNKLISEDTRFTHPIDNYRSINVTDFKFTPYIHVNPQFHIQDINDRLGLDSRAFAKDNMSNNYNQSYLDNGEALPPKQNLNKQISSWKNACSS